jgi:polar amino acid transport system substrate-binding protein
MAVFALGLVLALGTSTLPQAQQKPYVVCSDIPWDPFEMVTAGGEFFGFDLDVMRALAVIEGYQIEIQNLAFDSIIPAVQAGKCDIGASGFTITAEREKSVDFSNPYWLSNQAVIIRQDSGWTTLDEVFCCSHKIGAQRGTTGAAWVEENLINKGVDVELVLYETYPLAVLDLVNGRIDAVVQDEPASQQSIRAYPNVLTIAGIIETNEYFGFNVAEGDPNGLLPKINEGMTQLGLQLALQLVEADGGEAWKVALKIVPGSPWDNLVKAYFGASPDVIEQAWLSCKDKILNAQSFEDVADFASCMAEKTGQ